jgi:hypothetical protein
MKFAFEIKTVPVTWAAVIMGIVTFASGSLGTIAIYVDTPLAGIFCAVCPGGNCLPCSTPCSLLIVASCNFCDGPIGPPLPLSGTMERGAADAAPPPVVPLVFQVSPLPGSTDREEYFYEASPDDCNGPFAATRAFFLVRGHVVAVHDCPDIAKF